MLALLSNKYLIGAVAGIGLLLAVWFAGERHGRLSCEAAQNKAANEIAQSYADQADELRASKTEREVVTREKVRTIYVEKDPTGCADHRGLDSVLDSLRPSAD